MTLPGSYIIGQSYHYNTLSDSESSLINDLFSYMNDTQYIDIDFVVSPLLIHSIDEKDYSSHSSVLKKYSFKPKAKKENNDTLIIRNNDLFEFVNLELLEKYEGVGMIIIPNSLSSDSLVIFTPLLYYIEKEYNKKGICYFKKPVFSENKKYAIAEYYTDYGSLCVMEKLFLWRK